MTYPHDMFKNGKTAWIVLIGLTLCMGTLLRFHSLGTQSLWIDEGYSINAARSIQGHGYALMDSGEVYKRGLTGAEYLIALSERVFGLDPLSPWSSRLPSAFFGVLTIVAGFIFTRALFPLSAVPWVTGFLLTFSTWEIAWSRQARGYIILQFFITLAFYFFWKWLRNQNWRNLSLTIVSFTLAFVSHAVSLIFAPAFIVLFILHLILYPDRRPPLKNMLIAGSTGLITLIFLLYAHQPSLTGFDYSRVYLAYLCKELGIFTFCAVVGLIVGLFDKKRFWPSIFLTTAISVPLVVVMEYGQLIHMRYLFPLFPFILVLGAYLISTFVEGLAHYLNLNPVASKVISVILALVIFNSHLTLLPAETYSLERDSPQPDFKSAYSVITQRKGEGDLIISPYTMLSKIYLGESGIWLPISLTGKASELARRIAAGEDYYTGAPLVSNTDELGNILHTKKGFIVLDQMACNRLWDQCDLIVKHAKVQEIYASGTGLNEIRLFYFRPD